MRQLSSYSGKPLSSEQRLLLQVAVDHGCTCSLARGKYPRTISVLKDGIKLCYINDSVITDGAIIGYTFRLEDGVKNINGCPPERLQGTLSKIKRRYNAKNGWKLYPDDGPQRKGNLWYRYLHVTDFSLAKKICNCFDLPKRATIANKT